MKTRQDRKVKLPIWSQIVNRVKIREHKIL